MSTEQPPDRSAIPTSRRIDALITALADPDNTVDPPRGLTGKEREAIRYVTESSNHPFAGLAGSLLDRWDDLDGGDRLAGLLLFSQLIKQQRRERTLDVSRRRDRGVGTMSPTGACPNCDAETRLTPQGLCRRCRGELRFIIRPEAHREQQRRHRPSAAEQAALKALESPGITVIASYPEDNALWVCDLCNSRIPVEGDTTLIPLLASWALCYECVSDIPYWPDAWCEPRPRACRCSTCQLAVARGLGLDTTLPRGVGL